MKITLVAHDIRSTHNVGAFLRTCDGLGIQQVIFSGYTPYPKFDGDTRLPHFSDKITRQIHKTALGAESLVDFMYLQTLDEVLLNLRSTDHVLVALEQHNTSLPPKACVQNIREKYNYPRVALFVGNEVHGINSSVLEQMNYIMEIPMRGCKESLNVSVATAIALYELTRESQ